MDETLKETGVRLKIVGKVGERISPETKVHTIYFRRLSERTSGTVSRTRTPR